MKKILLLLITITFLTGCRSDDDNGNTSKEFFHPPSWIQGKWGVDGMALHRFTNDDFLLVLSNTETSFKGLLQQNANMGMVASVDETINDSNYNFIIKYGGGGTPTQQTEYKFKKISSTKIEWVNSPYAGTMSYYLTKMN